MTPGRRRRAIQTLCKKHPMSERKACKLLSQHRSTQRYVRKVRDGEKELIDAIKREVKKHPRWGYRLIGDRLRNLGWVINRKRMYRLWKQLGFTRRVKRRRRRNKGASKNSCSIKKSRGMNDVWTYDFLHDRTEDNRGLKFLIIEDEYARECVSIMVKRSITSKDVVGELSRLFAKRGIPNFIRSDNGPEFVAKAVEDWLGENQIGPLYIQPGSPWENAYVESFNARFRDELLNVELFTSVLEAQVVAEALLGVHHSTSSMSDMDAFLSKGVQHNSSPQLTWWHTAC